MDAQIKDFDFDRASVTITPEKGSNARQLRISGSLIAMLNALPYEYCFRNPKLTQRNPCAATRKASKNNEN